MRHWSGTLEKKNETDRIRVWDAWNQHTTTQRRHAQSRLHRSKQVQLVELLGYQRLLQEDLGLLLLLPHCFDVFDPN